MNLVARRNKGNHLFKAKTEYISLEIITNGNNITYDSIIEIAALKVINNVPTEKFETLIKPEIGNFSNNYLIPSSELEKAPEVDVVMSSLHQFTQGFTLTGFNLSKKSINFIYDKMKFHTGFELFNDYIDTSTMSARILQKDPGFKVHEYYDKFGFDLRHSHRAMPYAVKTFHYYEYLKDYMNLNKLSWETITPKMVKRKQGLVNLSYSAIVNR
jgi:DNA polymerase-3 subunit epsilon